MKTDRYALSRRLIELLEPPLVEEGFDLLDIRVFAGGGRMTVRLFLDVEGGMTLQRCMDASRTSGNLLEEADLIPGAYVIESSSPGVRRPLRTHQHFAAAVGENIVLKLAGGGSRAVRGRLVSVDENGFELAPRLVAGADQSAEAETENRTVPFADVREANLDPEFDAQALINADRRRRKEEKRQARQERREARQQKRAPRKNDPTRAGDGS